MSSRRITEGGIKLCRDSYSGPRPLLSITGQKCVKGKGRKCRHVTELKSESTRLTATSGGQGTGSAVTLRDSSSTTPKSADQRRPRADDGGARSASETPSNTSSGPPNSQATDRNRGRIVETDGTRKCTDEGQSSGVSRIRIAQGLPPNINSDALSQ